jgi:hypothetical protein
MGDGAMLDGHGRWMDTALLDCCDLCWMGQGGPGLVAFLFSCPRLAFGRA